MNLPCWLAAASAWAQAPASAGRCSAYPKAWPTLTGVPKPVITVDDIVDLPADWHAHKPEVSGIDEYLTFAARHMPEPLPQQRVHHAYDLVGGPESLGRSAIWRRTEFQLRSKSLQLLHCPQCASKLRFRSSSLQLEGFASGHCAIARSLTRAVSCPASASMKPGASPLPFTQLGEP